MRSKGNKKYVRRQIGEEAGVVGRASDPEGMCGCTPTTQGEEREGGEKKRFKLVGEKDETENVFSLRLAINLLKCSWPDILLVPLIDGLGAKKKMVPLP